MSVCPKQCGSLSSEHNLRAYLCPWIRQLAGDSISSVWTYSLLRDAVVRKSFVSIGANLS